MDEIVKWNFSVRQLCRLRAIRKQFTQTIYTVDICTLHLSSHCVYSPFVAMPFYVRSNRRGDGGENIEVRNSEEIKRATRVVYCALNS